MIIKALFTFSGILDLSALERLQEQSIFEQYPFRLHMRPGDIVNVDDKFLTLTSVQNALSLGYIEIGNLQDGSNPLTPNLIDPSYMGTSLIQIAGENISIGDVVFYSSDEKVYKAKGDSTSTMICIGIATEDAVANAEVILLIDGLMRNSSIFSFTAGGQASATALVYISEATAGAITQVRPTTSTNIVQIIGHATTSDILNLKIDHTYIELA